jgi:hypothetical protein
LLLMKRLSLTVSMKNCSVVVTLKVETSNESVGLSVTGVLRPEILT